MKLIYLVRHAKSFWGDNSVSDFDRPLNKRGKRDAPFMGDVLKNKKVKPNIIISSPAKRTKITAIEIAKKIKYPEKEILFNEELYEASFGTIIKILNMTDEKINSLILFGHNPGLTLLNNFISNYYLDNIPTCGIVALQFNLKWCELGKNTCKFLFFEYPKLYFK
jgi:phosphohistidine phosphatase